MENSTRHTIVLRTACAIAALAAVFALSACNKDNSSSAGGSTSQTTAESTTAASVMTTTATTPATTAPVEITSVAWCNGDGVLIRSGPGTDYKGIGALYVGDKVTVLGKEGDWFKIAFKDGPNGAGYASAQYLQGSEVTKPAAPLTTATAAS